MKLILNAEDLDALTPLEAGIYDAVIVGVDDTDDIGNPILSKNGNPMVVWTFDVRGVDKVNNVLKMWTVTAQGKNAQYLRTLKTLLGNKGGSINSEELIGREVKIEVSQSISQTGEPMNTVKKIL